MNIKTNEEYDVAKNSFGKYVYSNPIWNMPYIAS
jgi:hypothetical protein